MSYRNLVENIARGGGMALSTGFYVSFSFDDTSSAGVKSVLDNNSLFSDGFNYAEQFLDEVTLPGTQAATGQLTGRFMGEGVTNYVHQKMFTDFQLSWMCDANMSPYKFIQTWYQFIFQEFESDQAATEIPTVEQLPKGSTFEQMISADKRTFNRTTRLRFPTNYHCTVRIAKAEKGPNSEVERVPTVHVLQEVFPYTVDAVPLSFGSSQIVKCTANFYYGKHRVVYNDIKTSKSTPFAKNIEGNIQDDVTLGGTRQIPSANIT